MTGVASTGGTERLYGGDLVAGCPSLDLAVHYDGTHCILEGEAAGLDSRSDAASMVRKMLARLGKQPSSNAFHSDAARQIRAMTGFDRVMIYRFSGAGEVIADATAGGVESFLGLHYPASDIPRTTAESHDIAGALCVPLWATPTDYLMVFRRERQHDVQWAGRLEKAFENKHDIPLLRRARASLPTRNPSAAARTISKKVRVGLPKFCERD